MYFQLTLQSESEEQWCQTCDTVVLIYTYDSVYTYLVFNDVICTSRIKYLSNMQRKPLQVG